MWTPTIAWTLLTWLLVGDRKEGIRCHIINLSRSIEEQGPFDVIIQKTYYWFHQIKEGSSTAAAEMARFKVIQPEIHVPSVAHCRCVPRTTLRRTATYQSSTR